MKKIQEFFSNVGAHLSRLIKKIFTIKILVGVVLSTFLLAFGFLNDATWVVIILSVLGIREVSKKIENKMAGK